MPAIVGVLRPVRERAGVPLVHPSKGHQKGIKMKIIRAVLVVAASAGLVTAGLAANLEVAASASTTPTPPFKQCPAVGYNTSCSLLIDVETGGAAILDDPANLDNARALEECVRLGEQRRRLREEAGPPVSVWIGKVRITAGWDCP